MKEGCCGFLSACDVPLKKIKASGLNLHLHIVAAEMMCFFLGQRSEQGGNQGSSSGIDLENIDDTFDIN